MRTAVIILFVAFRLSAVTCYVSTTGNDSNTYSQAQSQSTPWLTVGHGMATINSGDILLLADGTYTENLQPSKSYTATTLIASQSGNRTNCIITGASSTWDLNQRQVNNTVYSNLTISAHTTENNIAVYLENCTNTVFVNCTITRTLQAASGVTNLVINGCFINQFGTDNSTGIQFGTATNVLVTNTIIALNGDCIASTTQSGAQIVNCLLFSTNTYGISCQSSVNGCTNLTINGCTFVSHNPCINLLAATGLNVLNTSLQSPSGHPMYLGYDDAYNPTYAGLISGVISNCSITGTAAADGIEHGAFIGANCANFSIVNSTVFGADFSLVIKENVNCSAIGNTVYGGHCCGIIAKGCTNAVISGNTIFSGTNTPGVWPYQNFGIFMTAGDNTSPGHPFHNVISTSNTVVVLNANGLALWWPSTGDGGSNVNDYNVYEFAGSPQEFGSVLGTSPINSLNALQAAWAGYSPSGNDSHSGVGPYPAPRITATSLAISKAIFGP